MSDMMELNDAELDLVTGGLVVQSNVAVVSQDTAAVAESTQEALVANVAVNKTVSVIQQANVIKVF
jgi:hypothetical protein